MQLLLVTCGGAVVRNSERRFAHRWRIVRLEVIALPGARFCSRGARAPDCVPARRAAIEAAQQDAFTHLAHGSDFPA